MSWLIRMIAGPAGTYVLIGIAALVFTGGAASAVQTWRLKSVKTELAEGKADLTICHANQLTLQASIENQNTMIAQMKQNADAIDELGRSAAYKVLAKPIQITGGDSPQEVTLWFANLLSPSN